MRVTMPCLSAGVRLNDMRPAARVRLAELAAVIRRGRAARRESGCLESRVACFRRVSLRTGKEAVGGAVLAARTKQSGRRGA
ncbi:hypothetical protein WK59_27870 [Burkholderia ubonensis]|nr:hypothetical protein WK59_27870 [Burkholderia ubonensis]